MDEETAAKKRSAGVPTISKVAPTVKVPWMVPFSAEGVAGKTAFVQVQPGCLFRASEMFASDTSSRPGYGTSILAGFVGSKPQRVFGPPNWTGVPAWMFSEWIPSQDEALLEKLAATCDTPAETEDGRRAAARIRQHRAAQVPWDTCEPALFISLTILFRETCRFDAVLVGQTVL